MAAPFDADGASREKIMTPTSLRKALLPGLLGLAAFGLTGWGLLGLHAKEAPPEAAAAIVHQGDALLIPERSPLRRSLAVAPVAQQSVAQPFTLPAVVEADPARLVKIAPPLAGRIVRLNKQLGDAVKAGEVLFVLDAPDFALANADAAKARAALALAAHNLERQRELDKSELAVRRDLEQAQSDYAQAASESARADARLSQTGARAGAAAGGKLAVRSPISGRVVELAAAEGAYWNDATAPLMTVADLSRVFVSASAQEKDLARVYVGQQASVKVDAYAEPVTGQVRYVGEMLDPDTRTVKVRLPFDNRDGRLKPGMFAEATLLSRAHQGMLVPMAAVVQSGFSSRAFVEVKPWNFVPRELKLGAQIGQQVEVLAGLQAGDRIVVKDGVLLND